MEVDFSVPTSHFSSWCIFSMRRRWLVEPRSAVTPHRNQLETSSIYPFLFRVLPHSIEKTAIMSSASESSPNAYNPTPYLVSRSGLSRDEFLAQYDGLNSYIPNN